MGLFSSSKSTTKVNNDMRTFAADGSGAAAGGDLDARRTDVDDGLALFGSSYQAFSKDESTSVDDGLALFGSSYQTARTTARDGGMVGESITYSPTVTDQGAISAALRFAEAQAVAGQKALTEFFRMTQESIASQQAAQEIAKEQTVAALNAAAGRDVSPVDARAFVLPVIVLAGVALLTRRAKA